MTINTGGGLAYFFLTRYAKAIQYLFGLGATTVISSFASKNLFLSYVDETLQIVFHIYVIFFVFICFTWADTQSRREAQSSDSKFPKVFFSYPVSDLSLVLWPLMVGSCVLIINWYFFLKVYRGLTESGSFWWPILFMISLLVWLQAISWRAFRYPGFYLATILGICLVGARLSYLLMTSETADMWFILLFAAQLLYGFFLTIDGVHKSRVGHVPEPWQWLTKLTAFFCEPAANVRQLQSLQPAYASPLAAMKAYEWQIHWVTFPAMALITGILLTLLRDPTPPSATRDISFLLILVMVFIYFALLFTPVWPSYQKSSGANNSGGVPTGGQNQLPAFIATLPITSKSLVMAKFLSYSKNVIIAFEITLLFLLLNFTIVYSVIGDAISDLVSNMGIFRFLIAIAGFLLLTLCYLIASGLTVISILLFKRTRYQQALLFVFAVFVLIAGYFYKNHEASVLALFPKALTVLVILKFISMAWCLPKLAKERAYTPLFLELAALVWACSVACCYFFVDWTGLFNINKLYLFASLIAFTPLLWMLCAPTILQDNRSR